MKRLNQMKRLILWLAVWLIVVALTRWWLGATGLLSSHGDITVTLMGWAYLLPAFILLSFNLGKEPRHNPFVQMFSLIYVFVLVGLVAVIMFAQ